MPPDENAADTGILSLDQAVSQMVEEEERQESAPAEATPETNTEATPKAEEVPEPETATEDETQTEDEPEAEGQEPQQPALDPPKFWAAEEKELFRTAPRNVQEAILRHEEQRSSATSKAIQEAAEKRKAADGEVTRLTDFGRKIDALLPQAQQAFQSRWANVDWNKVVDEHGAETALKLRNDFEREMQVVQQLQFAKDESDNLQFAKFVEAENAKLPQVAPDLADAKDGPKRREELGKFLVGQGIPAASIRNMSAMEASLAYDAMRWRNAQAEAKANAGKPKTPTQAAQPPRPSVRNTAAPTSRNPQTQRLQQLSRKARLTTDEAVEQMLLEEQQAS